MEKQKQARFKDLQQFEEDQDEMIEEEDDMEFDMIPINKQTVGQKNITSGSALETARFGNSKQAPTSIGNLGRNQGMGNRQSSALTFGKVKDDSSDLDSADFNPDQTDFRKATDFDILLGDSDSAHEEVDQSDHLNNQGDDLDQAVVVDGEEGEEETHQRSGEFLELNNDLLGEFTPKSAEWKRESLTKGHKIIVQEVESHSDDLNENIVESNNVESNVFKSDLHEESEEVEEQQYQEARFETNENKKQIKDESKDTQIKTGPYLNIFSSNEGRRSSANATMFADNLKNFSQMAKSSIDLQLPLTEETEMNRSQEIATWVSPRTSLQPTSNRKPPLRPGYGPKSSSQLNTPSRNRHQHHHEVDSEESQDEDAEDCGIEMKTIKFLFRIDNLFVRAKSIRTVLFFQNLKSNLKMYAGNRLSLETKVRALSKMNFIKKFSDKVKFYPRKAFLKWKLLSDEALIARLVTKIALNSRLNHMVALYRLRHRCLLNKIARQKELRSYKKAFEQIIELQEDLQRKKNDSHLNLIRGFNRIKDKYHRTVKVEILANRIESIFNKRNHLHTSVCRLKSIIKRRDELVRTLIQRQKFNHYQSFTKLTTLLGSRLPDPDLDLESLTRNCQSILKGAVAKNISSLFERVNNRSKGLTALKSLGDNLAQRSNSDGLKSLIDHARNAEPRESPAERLCKLLHKIMNNRLANGIKGIAEKAVSKKAWKVKNLIKQLYSRQEEKMRHSVQEMIYRVVDIITLISEPPEKKVVKFLTDFSKLERRRKKQFFDRLKEIQLKLDILAASQATLKWVQRNKESKFENTVARSLIRLESFLTMQDILRKIFKNDVRFGFIRIRNESLTLHYFGQTNKILREQISVTFKPMINKRLRLAMLAIKRQAYRRFIKRIKLDQIIASPAVIHEEEILPVDIVFQRIGLSNVRLTSSKSLATV